jgi:uncharacterized protein with HEPN domain
MPRSATELLKDVRAAAELIAQFTAGRALPDYSTDALMRSAVERQFIIVGEAVAQLERLDPATAAPITNHAQVIAFRNILVHGYSAIDDQIVWSVIQNHLPLLRQEIDKLLSCLTSP